MNSAKAVITVSKLNTNKNFGNFDHVGSKQINESQTVSNKKQLHCL